MHAVIEATAPCRLELIDGPLTSAGSGPRAPSRLAVALDRRVFCRVERAESGVLIHSKDTLQKVEAEDLSGLGNATGAVARVARALALAGVESGVRVVTQERVPQDAGLQSGAALSVALAGALGRQGAGAAEVLGKAAAIEAALDAETAESDLHAAACGGAHVLMTADGQTIVRKLAVDPARIEECLLLVDPGGVDLRTSDPPALEPASVELVLALQSGRYEDVAAALARVHRGRFDDSPSAVSRIVRTVEEAGGAAWPSGRLLAVWAVPGRRSDGPREAVGAALKETGVRTFPVRIDVRGLEIE